LHAPEAGSQGLAGETALIIRHLLVPLTVAGIALHAGSVLAQGAFPAPLPNRGAQQNDPAFPPANDPAFPPVNGGAPTASVGAPPAASFPTNGAAPVLGGGGGFAAPPSPAQQAAGADCMKQFLPLREEAERRGKLIKAASDRHAPPTEACKLISSFGQAELKMIKFVEAHQAKCGIPQQIPDQLKAGHKNTEKLESRVCGVAKQMEQRGPAGPSLSEVLGSATAVPQATASKKGGSTFDTLNGNVLAR
jgi:hypothetical protein